MKVILRSVVLHLFLQFQLGDNTMSSGKIFRDAMLSKDLALYGRTELLEASSRGVVPSEFGDHKDIPEEAIYMETIDVKPRRLKYWVPHSVDLKMICVGGSNIPPLDMGEVDFYNSQSCCGVGVQSVFSETHKHYVNVGDMTMTEAERYVVDVVKSYDAGLPSGSGYDKYVDPFDNYKPQKDIP